MFECGVDVVRIDRIAKSIQNPRFLERVFSAEEIEAFARKNMPVQSIAAAFSAKEAFSKALGTGVRGFSSHTDEIAAAFVVAYPIPAEKRPETPTD